MSDKRYRLTPQLRGQIVAGVRSGGYAHVVAEAWGVPRSTFDDWLKRGEGKNARDPYLAFAHEMRQAEAQARLRAEMQVFQSDPKVWLEHGPCRETPTRPGWSVSVKPAEAAAEDSRNALLDPELMQLFRTLLGVLAPFPEARVKVAESLMEMQAAGKRG